MGTTRTRHLLPTDRINVNYYPSSCVGLITLDQYHPSVRSIAFIYRILENRNLVFGLAGASTTHPRTPFNVGSMPDQQFTLQLLTSMVFDLHWFSKPSVERCKRITLQRLSSHLKQLSFPVMMTFSLLVS